MASSSKNPKLGEPSPKKRKVSSHAMTSRELKKFNDFQKNWGALHKSQDGELKELKKRQAKESKELQKVHTNQLSQLKRGQWKGLAKENGKQLNEAKKRHSKELEKLDERHEKELEDLEGEQRKVLLETTDLIRPDSYPDGKISSEEMAKCNLKEYKLSDVVFYKEHSEVRATNEEKKEPPEVKDLTMDVMVNDFLMFAFNLKHTKLVKEGEHLFSEEVDPKPEFYAVLQGLRIYCEQVPPERALDLFQGGVSRKMEEKLRGWGYLVKLSQEEIPFFKEMNTDEKRGFVKRMSKIMGEGEKVDIIGWQTCLIGYIYGFWLAKLYNKRGIEDEQLPGKLSDVKRNFIEYPWDLEHAYSGFHYDQLPIKP